ncbi:MAG: hypothetical protein QXQ77_02070 [Candidatus Aenigmatarchaeota archaeon]
MIGLTIEYAEEVKAEETEVLKCVRILEEWFEREGIKEFKTSQAKKITNYGKGSVGRVLDYLMANNRIKRIKRGLYAVLPKQLKLSQFSNLPNAQSIYSSGRLGDISNENEIDKAADEISERLGIPKILRKKRQKIT